MVKFTTKYVFRLVCDFYIDIGPQLNLEKKTILRELVKMLPSNKESVTKSSELVLLSLSRVKYKYLPKQYVTAVQPTSGLFCSIDVSMVAA